MNRVLSATVAVIVGVVFIGAGLLKIVEPVSFYHAILLYHLVGDDFSWQVAHFLPWLEVVAGVAVIVPSCRPSAACVLAVLLLVFMGAVGSAWWRGLNIECGCFGRFSGASSYLWVLIRDFLLLLAVLYRGGSSFFGPRTRG